MDLRTYTEIKCLRAAGVRMKVVVKTLHVSVSTAPKALKRPPPPAAKPRSVLPGPAEPPSKNQLRAMLAEAARNTPHHGWRCVNENLSRPYSSCGSPISLPVVLCIR